MKYQAISPRGALLAVSMLIWQTPGVYAAEEKAPDPYRVENQWFTFRLITRTPEQMAGFYEGRGFNRTAIDRIRQACFLTTVIRNHGKEVVWLELKNWQFYTVMGSFQRISRSQWQKYWVEDKLSTAHQATFGWTLLPETRNLQPSEPVGGNLTLPDVEGPFSLVADFYLGQDKKSGKIRINLENIQCRKE